MFATSKTLSSSFWEQDSFLDHQDVIIVGSGLVGLNAALSLRDARPNWRITVLERGSLPSGASTRNAGFACFGSLSELLDDEAQGQSEAQVLDLVAWRWEGLQRLRERLGDAALHYKGWGGYEIFRPEESARFDSCQAAMGRYNQALRPLTGREATYEVQTQRLPELGFQGVDQLIANKAEGQLHTGEMMRQLLRQAQAADIQILNGLELLHFEQKSVAGDWQLELHNGWKLQSPRLLLATNGFALQFFPEMDLSAARNQVLITEELENMPLRGCFHYERGYVYFRNVGRRLLLGGGRHIALQEEQTPEFGLSQRIQDYLEQLLRSTLLPQAPDIHIAQRWSGIMGVGAVKRPIVQKEAGQPVLALRLGGMGVAIGAAVGEKAAALILAD